MISNFLIGLREGLEAALVVGILVAYLVKTGHRQRLAPVWAGVAIAIVASLAFGAALTFTSAAMSDEAQEAFAGVLSVIAVGFVTWMVFWMRRTSRHLRADLQGRLDTALAMGAGALLLTALLAVGREGLETALFVWAAVQSQATDGTAGPLVGVALGLGLAALLGWLIYNRSVRLDLAMFFRLTGAALVVVAAGVFAYAIHDLQEARWLPGAHSLAFNVSRQIPPGSWYGALLKGIFNFSPEFSWLQLLGYLAYVVPVLVLFFRRPPVPVPVPTAPESVSTGGQH